MRGNLPNMASVLDYYIDAFSPQSLFGFYHLVGLLSIVILIWMWGLGYLVIRANPNSMENRFISILLVCEGLKASFLALDFFVYSSPWQDLWDILFPLKMEAFMTAQIVSILLYLSFPVYYRVNILKFMNSQIMKNHVWYVAPLLGILFWLFLRTQQGFTFDNASWIICSQPGTEPIIQNWWGSVTDQVLQYAEDIGTCSRPFDRAVVEEPVGLWGIILLGPIISLVGLLFLRASMKQSQQETENLANSGVLPSRSLYIGFLGKVIGQIIFFVFVLIILPTLNGGVFFEFADSIRVQYGADPTAYDRILYFIWNFTLVIAPVSVGFEALMFVHATLKDTVFGIDSNLRKTFTNTIFTGIGAMSFLIVSEAMENVVGYGMLGGVIIGGVFIVSRRPILTFIDGISGKLIPSEFSESELKYLEAFKEAIEDNTINSRERKLLANLADAYGINQERLEHIEKIYKDSLDSNRIIKDDESEELDDV